MTPNEISEASSCFACIEDKAAARLYLLGRIAEITDPTVIASNSAGFNLPISDQVLALVLLAQMAGVTNLDEIISGSACYIGLNERAAALYLAEVIAAGGSGGGGSGAIWEPANNVISLLDLIGDFTEVTLSGIQTVIGTLTVRSSPNLVSLNAPVLESTDQLTITNNASLTDLSFPLFQTSPNGFTVSDCPLLVDVAFPVWLPSNGQSVSGFGNALSQASVNHILARCVANPGFVIGSVQLDGGTNAAPAGQGAADVITLTGRGVTVTTN